VLGEIGRKTGVSTFGCRESGNGTRDPSQPAGKSVASPLPRRSVDAHRMEGAMAYVNVLRGVVGFFEHALVVFVGFVLMVIGLALGVTMIMLPAGIVIGLLGLAMFVGGLFVRLDQK
jgi:hypothetical protein